MFKRINIYQLYNNAASKLIYLFIFFFSITFFPFLLLSNFIIIFPSTKIDLFLFHIPLFFFCRASGCSPKADAEMAQTTTGSAK